MSARHVTRLLRPRHWVKNVFVLAPLVFAGRAADVRAWAPAAVAFGAFCLLSSASYAINDIADAEADRLHERKRLRPVARGDVTRQGAVAVALVCLAAGVALCLSARLSLCLIGLAYVALHLAYTFALKRVFLADVACIGAGFVLRALGGGAAVGVPVSAWLIVCTFCLCVFLGFAKRRGDTAAVFAGRVAERAVPRYTAPLLDGLMDGSGLVTLAAYMLYTLDPATAARFGTPLLVLSVPLVVCCVWRVGRLVRTRRAAGPTEAVTQDGLVIALVVAWSLYVAVIATWGHAIQAALSGWLLGLWLEWFGGIGAAMQG